MGICDWHFLEAVRIIVIIINILKIIVPLALVCMGTWDVMQVVMNPDKNSGVSKLKVFGTRVFSALVIFMTPTLISVLFNLGSNYFNPLLLFNDCVKNANKEYIAALKAYALEQAEENLKNDKSYSATYQEPEIPNSSQSGQTSQYDSTELLAVAEKIWKQIANGDYSYGGSQIPNTGSTVDCSGYVSWVLYELGYKEEFEGWQHVTSGFVSTNWNEKFGWEEIEISAGEDVSSKLQPGDILVRDPGTNNGHMNITVKVENGTVYAYDCGSQSNWKNSNGGQPIDKSRFAKSDSRPGKIIRVSSSSSSGSSSSNSSSSGSSTSSNSSSSSSSSSSNNTSTSNTQSNGKIVVIDPGHGKSSNDMTDSEKKEAGFTQYNGSWGEWRHFKTGTWGQECQGSGGPTDYSCWYPIGSGDREIEPEINLNYALAAKKYLEQMGYEVRMTRTSNNENPSFNKRALYAFKNNDSSNEPDAAAIICLHSNASNGSASGSAYISLSGGSYSQKYIKSDYISKSNALGKAINDEIVKQTSLNAFSGGVISNQSYLILFHKSPVPVAYMEIGFFDNSSDLQIMRSETDKIGKAIADGVNKGLS